MKHQPKKYPLKYFQRKVGFIQSYDVFYNNYRIIYAFSPLHSDPAIRQIKMKIHNLNVEDLMDEHRHTRLLDVFRKVLWQDSSPDLHLVELYSALAAGGRRPARRQDGEGCVIEKSD